LLAKLNHRKRAIYELNCIRLSGWPRSCEHYTTAPHFYIIRTLCVCLSVSEGKHRPLFAPTDVHKTSCNTQQFSVQRAIANLSCYLPFKMAGSVHQTMCHVLLPVSDISNSLPHSPVNRQADCGTAGHRSVVPSQVLFQQTAVQQHIFTPLSHSPTYQCTLCQYTYRT